MNSFWDYQNWASVEIGPDNYYYRTVPAQYPEARVIFSDSAPIFQDKLFPQKNIKKLKR